MRTRDDDTSVSWPLPRGSDAHQGCQKPGAVVEFLLHNGDSGAPDDQQRPLCNACNALQHSKLHQHTLFHKKFGQRCDLLT